MFAMILRATSLTTFVTTIVACICYLFINKNTAVIGSFPFAICLSAAFAIYVATATEVFHKLFDRQNPSVGIPLLMLAGIVVYLMSSRILGTPLFSDSIKNGIVGCVFFNAYAGCILYMAYRENSSSAYYLFSGMIAGFMFQPFMTVMGLAAEANLNLALAGSLVGAAVGFLQRVFINQELNKVINNVNHEVF